MSAWTWSEAVAYANYMGEGPYDEPREDHEPEPDEQPIRREARPVVADVPEEECPF